MSTMSALAMLVLILLVLGVYWLPSILARVHRHPDLVPIVVVNALLGWTVVGWVWALARLVHAGTARRLELVPVTATVAAGEAREGDLRTGVGSAVTTLPLEP
jgi:Superinfection immunity protein